MTPKASFFLFSVLALLFAARAQERAPHGLVFESPVAFSPSAVEFFHPKTQEPNTEKPCAGPSACSPLPLAAEVEYSRTQETKVSSSQKGGSHLGASSIAGIVLGLAFAVLLAMAGFYVFITRKANLNRDNSVQPDA
ncbi:hypothetical protein P3X46_010035 [Hevea brasiliensis]|uniref:Transmembrane protein n=1 Tax=Hevea brasiliensis TaxID=3981 RepID=A0ABQ9MEW2_HEVBR|nr:uncharacterized protein LOC110651252 [Hevea brasiliensis]KAJ9178125.1 hypothetical protein P3X46_010035 [Hevea brasiliensis]